ncbi:MAG: hypothetical protein VW547_06110 [Alphaproteobacteria bacterium]
MNDAVPAPRLEGIPDLSDEFGLFRRVQPVECIAVAAPQAAGDVIVEIVDAPLIEKLALLDLLEPRPRKDIGQEARDAQAVALRRWSFVFTDCSCHGASQNEEGRILLIMTPDDKGDPTARAQHPPRFRRCGDLISRKHQSEPTGNSVETPRREGYSLHVGGSETYVGDANIGGASAGMRKHFECQVAGNEPSRIAQHQPDRDRRIAGSRPQIEDAFARLQVGMLYDHLIKGVVGRQACRGC